MPPAELDPREARPLTSREISKVLSGIIGGVIATSPTQKHFVVEVVRSVIDRDPTRITNIVPVELQDDCRHFDLCPSWACAFSATVSGLRGWCDPADVHTALAWIADHLELICTPDANVAPAN